MTSTEQRGICSSRVKSTSGANVSHFECVICRDILWKPVACTSCETPFCSTCINECLANHPHRCPNRCPSYTERRCPPFIARLLAELEITCFYKSEGCKQIILYEALEKHEQQCGYQPQRCPHCQSHILRKDFENHEKICTFVILTCQDCKLMYKRGDAATKHTENICLKEQLRQLRDASKDNKRLVQKLIQQLNEIRTRRTCMDQEVTIKFDDLRSAEEETRKITKIYRNLEWTGISYGHEVFFKNKYPTSGYVTSFIPGGSPHVAYFYREASINAEDPDDTFTLISLTVCAAWNDNLQLTITGYRNLRVTNTHTATLLFGKPQMILLQWKDIDKVTFAPSEGTVHPGIDWGGSHVVITQLTINLHD